ncbi:M48 family metallopeptidase [Patescibacteria group bacterium]|nr:M48 family metallopeptidase [Patescibacteria group bacterium]
MENNYPGKILTDAGEFLIEYVDAAKRTSSVRIRDGKVVLRLSRYARGRDRDEIVAKFLKWAVKKLKGAQGAIFKFPNYEDGARLCVHNKVYELSIVREDRKNVGFAFREGVLLEVKLPLVGDFSSKIRGLVEKCMMEDQLGYLEEVLEELNSLYFRNDYQCAGFRRYKSRFGSCTRDGRISIAYRLLFAPREVFRYVCIHELAHLIEFNHSQDFWKIVEGACPDYKIQNKWLRDKGFMLG